MLGLSRAVIFILEVRNFMKFPPKFLFVLFRLYAKFIAFVGLYLPFPKVKVLLDTDGRGELKAFFKAKRIKNPVIITDKVILDLGLHKNMERLVREEGMKAHIFCEIEADPSFESVEKGVRFCRELEVDAVIAIGGGSVIDAAKVINYCAKYNKKAKSVMGILRAYKKANPFIILPTTAGTGSEVTIAALISDKSQQKKHLALSPFFLPDIAYLDKELLRSLPKHMVAASGLDALTHAFEAYMSSITSSYTRKNSLEAMKLIYENLEPAYASPDDMSAKEQMLIASHKAGLAFTRANVGWVHAIAHQLGAIYGINHGFANAVLLPKVVKFYEKELAPTKMAEIARFLDLAADFENDEKAARYFSNWIDALSVNLSIPDHFSELKEEKIKEIAKRAYLEVILTPYPVPKYFADITGLEDLILSCVLKLK